MSEFPQTLAAIKEVKREETGGQCASDSAYWAVGDALIEECGSDPVWDVESDGEFCGGEFKGGLKLREAVDWLGDHGVETGDWELYSYREMAERFPPGVRSMRVTYMGHIQCGSVEEIRAFEANSEPHQVLGVIEDLDLAAHDKYGPA